MCALAIKLAESELVAFGAVVRLLGAGLGTGLAGGGGSREISGDLDRGRLGSTVGLFFPTAGSFG